MERSWIVEAGKALVLAGMLAGAFSGCRHSGHHAIREERPLRRSRSPQPIPCETGAPTPDPCAGEPLPAATYPNGPLAPPAILQPAPLPEGASPTAEPLPQPEVDSLPPAVPVEEDGPKLPSPSGAKRRRHGADPIPSLDAGSARSEKSFGEKFTSLLKRPKPRGKAPSKLAPRRTPAEPIRPEPLPAQDQGPVARHGKPLRIPAQPVRLSTPLDIHEFSDSEIADSAPGRFHPASVVEVSGREPRAQTPFRIDRTAICSQVRGQDDLTELDAGRLQPSQPVLIYASLSGFSTQAQGGVHRTTTESTVEIYLNERLVAEQSLGQAIDLASLPRSHYFLTHRFRIPEGLSDGKYVFRLVVRDLQGRQTATADVPVAITAGRSLPDETGDTAVFAAPPSSTR